MSKGIVMEVTSSGAVVMTEDGRFIRLRGNYTVGETVDITAERSLRVPASMWYSAAAVFFVCLVAFSVLANFGGKSGSPQAVAYISIDINPSIELGLNAQAIVIGAEGLNQDGQELLNEYDYANKHVTEVTLELLDLAEPYLERYLAQGEADIVIASTIVAGTSSLDEVKLQQEVRSTIEQQIKSKPAQVESPVVVAAVSVSEEMRADAQEKGISSGKLALGLILAKETGHSVPLEELETKSISTLAKELGGLGELVSKEKQDTGNKLRELFENSKKGRVDVGKDKEKDERDYEDKQDDRDKRDDEVKQDDRDKRDEKDKQDDDSKRNDTVKRGDRDKRDEKDKRDDEDKRDEKDKQNEESKRNDRSKRDDEVSQSNNVRNDFVMVRDNIRNILFKRISEKNNENIKEEEALNRKRQNNNGAARDNRVYKAIFGNFLEKIEKDRRSE